MDLTLAQEENIVAQKKRTLNINISIIIIIRKRFSLINYYVSNRNSLWKSFPNDALNNTNVYKMTFKMHY